jgi:SAM-dependent methyltransferase
MSDSVVFDRRAVRLHRERAARGFAAHDFLHREAASRLAERLDEIKRQFPCALALGAPGGVLPRMLAGRNGTATLIATDPAAAMLRRAGAGRPGVASHAVADEEWLPFAPASFDLVVSCLGLHWVNDLPGALVQIRRALKPDGLFLASLLGGATLAELRRALIEAEIAERGGASPRISPAIELREAAALLQRAGFALPVADSDAVTVRYKHALDLMRDLRGMGETNAVIARPRNFTRRGVLLRAAEAYRTMFADAEGRMPATFEIVTLTGWAPDESQPRALKPGSAAQRLADALGTAEYPAGDKAGTPRR